MKKEEKIEEVETEEVETKKEIKENKKEAADFLDEKHKSGILRKIFSIIFWLIAIVILTLWSIDWLNVRNNKKPSFCFSNKTHKYDDGKVTECVGLGYKIYKYERSSMNEMIEFVPFFIGIKESSK